MSSRRSSYIPKRAGVEGLNLLTKRAEENPDAVISWSMNFKVGLAVDIMVEALADNRSLASMIQTLCHEALTVREAKEAANEKTQQGD